MAKRPARNQRLLVAPTLKIAMNLKPSSYYDWFYYFHVIVFTVFNYLK